MTLPLPLASDLEREVAELRAENTRLRERVDRLCEPFTSADGQEWLAPTAEAYAATCKALHSAKEGNERLRWRHRDTLPDWNDLPDGLRAELVDIGRQMIDPHFGGDAMINVWAEIRKALKP